MLIGIARAVKAADRGAIIALSEPWAWHPHVSLADQSRPFATLLGRRDEVAERETGTDRWGGDSSLLQVVGLNFYNNWGVDQGWPLSRLLLEARRQFPEQRIFMGETGQLPFLGLSLGENLVGTARRTGRDCKPARRAHRSGDLGADSHPGRF